MFESLYSQIFAAVALAVAIFAYWKGEELEKAGITAFIIAWLATMVVQTDTSPYAIQYPVFAIDIVLLLVFVGMAWRSPRTWPIWAAGGQMFAVLGHVVLFIGLRPVAYSFHTLLSLAGYGVLASIAVGTFFAWQYRLASGSER